MKPIALANPAASRFEDPGGNQERVVGLLTHSFQEDGRDYPYLVTRPPKTI